jgi:hypothetical protein
MAKLTKGKKGFNLEVETHRRLIWLKCFLDKPPKNKISFGVGRHYKLGEIIDLAVFELYKKTLADLHSPPLPEVPGNMIECESDESAEEVVNEVHPETVPV